MVRFFPLSLSLSLFTLTNLSYLSATTHGPLPQSTFLYSLGLEPRLNGLLKNVTEARRKEIESAAKRLVDPLGMGKEYKVMGITSKSKGGVEGEECFPFVKDVVVV